MKKWFACLLALVLSMTLCGAAEAPEWDVADSTASATLTITCQYDRTPIAGVTFTLYRICYANVGNNAADGSGDPVVTYYDADGTTLTTFDGMTAIESNTYAQSCTASDYEQIGCETTDENGTVSFPISNLGMYLVVNTAATGDATTYTSYDPFLVSIPTDIDGTLTEDLTITPKTLVFPSDGDSNYPPDSDGNNPPDDGGNRPKTGDTINLFLVTGIGISTASIGVWIAGKRRRKKI